MSFAWPTTAPGLQVTGRPGQFTVTAGCKATVDGKNLPDCGPDLCDLGFRLLLWRLHG